MFVEGNQKRRRIWTACDCACSQPQKSRESSCMPFVWMTVKTLFTEAKGDTHLSLAEWPNWTRSPRSLRVVRWKNVPFHSYSKILSQYNSGPQWLIYALWYNATDRKYVFWQCMLSNTSQPLHNRHNERWLVRSSNHNTYHLRSHPVLPSAEPLRYRGHGHSLPIAWEDASPSIFMSTIQAIRKGDLHHHFENTFSEAPILAHCYQNLERKPNPSQSLCDRSCRWLHNQ